MPEYDVEMTATLDLRRHYRTRGEGKHACVEHAMDTLDDELSDIQTVGDLVEAVGLDHPLSLGEVTFDDVYAPEPPEVKERDE